MSARQNPTAASDASTRVEAPAAEGAPSPAPAPGSAPAFGRRALAALSALAFVGSVLLFIWVVQPLRRPVLSAACLLFIVLLAVAINVRAGESPREIGFRVDNLRAAARLVLPATLLLALPIVAASAALHAPVRVRTLALGLLVYPLWGLAQQYALQAVVYRRVRAAGAGAWSAPVASALFAVVHVPNPGLVLLTFVGGCVWCELYRRVPNLFVLGVSHGFVATLVLTLLPAGLTGGLRIGPDYLRHRAPQHAEAAAAFGMAQAAARGARHAIGPADARGRMRDRPIGRE